MLLSSCLLSSCLLFYMCCFLIRLFAVWRYAGRIFNAGICRGKAISEFRSPKALPLHPHPLGHGSNSSLLCVLRCWLLSVCCGTQNGTLCRSGFCILRYLWWYAGPICDLVLGFFGTYSGTLGRSVPCILRYLWWYAVPIPFLYSSILIGIFCTSLTFQDRTPSPLPSPACFSCRLEASARGRWHRAGLLRRRGDYYLGCGRRRYCGRVCCLSRRRVLALPQCF